jgi:hypothetical protein
VGQYTSTGPKLVTQCTKPTPDVTPKFLSFPAARSPKRGCLGAILAPPQTPPKFSTCLSFRSHYCQQSYILPKMIILTAIHIRSCRLPIAKFYLVKRPVCLAEDEAVAGDVVVAATAPTSNMMMKSSQSCPLRQSQNPCFRYTKTAEGVDRRLTSLL